MENKNKIIIYIIGTIIVLSLGLFWFFSSSQKEQNKFVVIPVDPEIKAKTEQQLPAIREQVAQNPTSSDVMQILARAELRMGNIANAQESIQKAIELDEKNPRAYLELGNIALTNGDQDEAEKQYLKSIELVIHFSENPFSDVYKNIPEEMRAQLPKENLRYVIPTPFSALARLYMEQDRKEDAIQILERGIQYVPQYPDFYLMLSELYAKNDVVKAGVYKKQFEGLMR